MSAQEYYREEVRHSCLCSIERMCAKRRGAGETVSNIEQANLNMPA